MGFFRSKKEPASSAAPARPALAAAEQRVFNVAELAVIAKGGGSFRSSLFHLIDPAYGEDNEDHVEAVRQSGGQWLVQKVTKFSGISLGHQAGPALEAASGSSTVSYKILKENVGFFEALYTVAVYEATQTDLYQAVQKREIAGKGRHFVDFAHDEDIIFNSNGLPRLTLNYRTLGEDNYPDSEIRFLDERRMQHDETAQREAAAAAERQRLAAEEAERERLRQAELAQKRQRAAEAEAQRLRDEEERRRRLPLAIEWNDASLKNLFNAEAGPQAQAEYLKKARLWLECDVQLRQMAMAIEGITQGWTTEGRYHGRHYYAGGTKTWDEIDAEDIYNKFRSAFYMFNSIMKNDVGDPEFRGVLTDIGLNLLMIEASIYFSAARNTNTWLGDQGDSMRHKTHVRLERACNAMESYIAERKIGDESAARARAFTVIPRNVTDCQTLISQISVKTRELSKNCQTASDNIGKLMQFGPVSPVQPDSAPAP